MSADAASIAATSSKSSVVSVMVTRDLISCSDVYQFCGVSGNDVNVPGKTFWSRVPVTTHAYAHSPSEVIGMFAVKLPVELWTIAAFGTVYVVVTEDGSVTVRTVVAGSVSVPPLVNVWLIEASWTPDASE